jgi:hypothetical protein
VTARITALLVLCSSPALADWRFCHQESQRRQYALVDRARELGFNNVAVIDE